MSSEKFFNSFLKYYDKINCSDGLQLVWTGVFERYHRNRDMDVPVYKINNPNNSPYTEESLTYFLDDAIDYFRKVMPLIDKSIQTQYLYILKSDDSIYIPMKIGNKIQSCLSKIEIVNFPFDVNGVEYLVSGNFNGDFDFETDGETVIVSLDFENFIEKFERNSRFIKTYILSKTDFLSSEISKINRYINIPMDCILYPDTIEKIIGGNIVFAPRYKYNDFGKIETTGENEVLRLG